MKVLKLIKILFNSILEAIQCIKDYKNSPGIKGR